MAGRPLSKHRKKRLLVEQEAGAHGQGSLSVPRPCRHGHCGSCWHRRLVLPHSPQCPVPRGHMWAHFSARPHGTAGCVMGLLLAHTASPRIRVSWECPIPSLCPLPAWPLGGLVGQPAAEGMIRGGDPPAGSRKSLAPYHAAQLGPGELTALSSSVEMGGQLSGEPWSLAGFHGVFLSAASCPASQFWAL